MMGRTARPCRGKLAGRWRRVWWLGLLVLLAVILSGCQTVSFYKQAIQGQYEILRARRPIPKVIADPKTSPELKERLQYVLALRRFAAQEMKLPVDHHYLDYADLKRRYVVWDVYAAPEFSITPKTWWYPLVGRLEYRGYFSASVARRYAAKLAGKGCDVYVSGVPAYSTLGWFKDPILNTFVFDPKSDLADTLFHELAHHRIFASGDTQFNEAFATTVGEEGVRRWLLAHNDPETWREFQANLKHDREFVRLILATRMKLAQLYAQFSPDSARQKKELERLRQQKAEIIEQLRKEYQTLRAQWSGYSGYDKWFANPINNAKLSTVSAYYKWVPVFRHLLEKHGGNLETFYQEVKGLSKLSKKERHFRMDQLLQSSVVGSPQK